MNWNLDNWNALAVDLFIAGVVLGVFLLAVLLLRLLWSRLLNPLLRQVGINPDDALLIPLRKLAQWALFFSGLYYATSSLKIVRQNVRLEMLLARGLSIAWALLALWTLVSLFNELSTRYVRRTVAGSEHPGEVNDLASLVRKIVTTVAVIIGVLYVLRVAGVDISPLLASAGIGGIALALAAQDTLSNLLSGFFLVIDRPVRLGDFVKLQSGEEGHVEEVGWRYTRIRSLTNSAIIIPNSKFSQALLTNGLC